MFSISSRTAFCGLSLLALGLFGGCDTSEIEERNDTESESDPKLSGCTDPVPLGKSDSGYEMCAEGDLHRNGPAQCISNLPRDPQVIAMAIGDADNLGLLRDECTTDEECPAPYGFCQVSRGMDLMRYCSNGCLTDADCESNQICVCGEDIGTCQFVPGNGCRSDSDCSGGALCLGAPEDVCSTATPVARWEFACESAQDECRIESDCEDYEQCGVSEGHRTCSGYSCE